ncbi:MAG: creatininase family protein [Planctomycetes bacterium]|nr:creatininase family protein [Planctomycetota bacterium]
MNSARQASLSPSGRRDFLKIAGILAAGGAVGAAQPAQADTVDGRDRRKYQELFPEEFYEEQRRAPIIYLPIGAPEEHGLQSVLAVDPWTAYEICLRAAALSHGIVFPIVPIAPAGHPSWGREELRRRAADAAPPSCFVGREVCKSLYIELMESLADLGFKSCIAFSGHFPGDVVLEEIEKEQGGVIRGMRFWGGGLVRILKDELERMDEEHPLWGGHGAMWETSILRALNEQWVDLSRVDRIQESPISHQLKDLSPEKIQAIKLANVEFGNRYLDLAAERAAKLASDLLDSTSPSAGG